MEYAGLEKNLTCLRLCFNIKKATHTATPAIRTIARSAPSTPPAIAPPLTVWNNIHKGKLNILLKWQKMECSYNSNYLLKMVLLMVQRNYLIHL